MPVKGDATELNTVSHDTEMWGAFTYYNTVVCNANLSMTLEGAVSFLYDRKRMNESVLFSTYTQ